LLLSLTGWHGTCDNSGGHQMEVC